MNKTLSCNTADRPRHPSTELKLNTLHRCVELGEDVEYVSREIGYSRCSIYKWGRIYLEKGAIGLMSSKKNNKREPLAPKHVQEPFTSEKAVDYQEQIDKLQLEVDVLKETINIQKKTPALT